MTPDGGPENPAIVLAAVLSLLLVGMQHEALLHEVDHLRAKVAAGHDKALQKSATIVEFWGLRASRDARVDLRDAARRYHRRAPRR
mgnify:CR=1 FL=1